MRAPVSRHRIGLSLLMLSLLILTLALGCGRQGPPHLLLLSIDTLRADHLGCYGYERATSPELDRFAARSVRYENASAPTPWTLPSHVAMLSGRHPYEVGIVDYRSSIPEDVPLLAESLRGAGYRTAAFVDSAPGGLLGAEHGFLRGFERYQHAPHAGPAHYRYDMAVTVDAALGWLEQRDPEAPFFLFLHTKSVHTTPGERAVVAASDAPYDKPQAYRTRFLPGGTQRFAWGEGARRGVHHLRALNERIADGRFDRGAFSESQRRELIGLYDAGIYYTDEHFGRLLAGLARLGLDRDTLVVVTADHGEAFGEHRFFLHKELYAPLLRVPLIVHDPRDPGGRVVSRPVALADVAPTLLERTGLPALPGASGRPLPRRDAETAPDRSFFHYFHFEPDHFYEAYALRDGDFKLVHHKLRGEPGFRSELYDTRRDPGELQRTAALLARLQARLETGARAPTLELGADAIESLRALGYLE
jgi:arylsulfatase A-like enzyme